MVSVRQIEILLREIEHLQYEFIGCDDEESREARWAALRMEAALETMRKFCMKMNVDMFMGFNVERYPKTKRWALDGRIETDNAKGKEQERMDAGRTREEVRGVQDNDSEAGVL